MKRWVNVLMLGTLVALAACSQAPKSEEPAATYVRGEVVSPSPDYVPQSAFMIMVDEAELDTADVLRLGPGVYASDSVPVAADGTFELPLPEADEMPASVLVPGNDFFNFPGATCSITASVAGARVSQYYAEGVFILLPGVAFLSFLGPSFSITTTAPFDFSDSAAVLYEQTLVSWLFATEDVALSAGETGCDVGGDSLMIDLDLKAGWNQVGLSFEVDPDTEEVVGGALENNDTEQLYFNLMGGAV